MSKSPPTEGLPIRDDPRYSRILSLLSAGDVPESTIWQELFEDAVADYGSSSDLLSSLEEDYAALEGAGMCLADLDGGMPWRAQLDEIAAGKGRRRRCEIDVVAAANNGAPLPASTKVPATLLARGGKRVIGKSDASMSANLKGAEADETEEGAAPAPAVNSPIVGLENHPTSDIVALDTTSNNTSQTAAAYEEMDRAIKNVIKETVFHTMAPPLPPAMQALSALAHEETGDAKKSRARAEHHSDDHAPVHEGQKKNANKKPELTEENHAHKSEDPFSGDDQRPSTIPPESLESKPTHATHQRAVDENPPDRMQHQYPAVLPIRPPPRSMLPSPNDRERKAPSIPMFHEVEATIVPNEPVYDAIPIDDRPRSMWNRRQKCFYAGVGIVVGSVAAAATAGISIGLSNPTNANNENNESSSSHPITIQPSQSAVPSSMPSLRPTLRPSHSLAPSAEATLHPSTSTPPSPVPSSHPSFSPSASSPPSITSASWPFLNWKQHDQTFNGGAPIDYFGNIVALSADGNTLAIGAPQETEDDNSNEPGPGYVKIYHRDGGASSSWKQLGRSIAGDRDGGQFGFHLSLSDDGKTLAVGAPYYQNGAFGFHSGQAKVYRFDEDALDYRQLGQTITSELAHDFFGWAVDLSADGKTLAIASPGTWLECDRPGHVNVYQWDDGGSSWTALGQSIFGDVNGDEFGWSISLSKDGKTLASGAVYNDGHGADTGQVKIYRWNETALDFRELGQSIIGEKAGDKFGHYVALSADGKTLASGGPNTGYVNVYHWDEAALDYRQLGETIRGKGGDYFGWSLDLTSDGETLAIGATGSFGVADRRGYASVYKWDDDGSAWTAFGQKILGGVKGEKFGWSVALSTDGRTLAGGAIYSDENGEDSGVVRVFTIE